MQVLEGKTHYLEFFGNLLPVTKSGDQLSHKFYAFRQCCGSGPTCFWASRIRIHLSKVWIRIRILLSSCKNSKKNLDSYYFVTLFDCLSLKNEVNVPSKSNKQKKLCFKISFLLASWRSMTKIAGSGSISQRHGSADPDPPQNVMDPQHCFQGEPAALQCPRPGSKQRCCR